MNSKAIADKALKKQEQELNIDLTDQVLRFAIQDEISKLNLELMRQHAAEEELRECSFAPKRSVNYS